MNRYKEIPSYLEWQHIEKINKGWSEDEKYYIETIEGTKMLLRISDSKKFELKKREFEVVRSLDNVQGTMSRAIDFVLCNEGKCVYSLLTWIEGEDAEDIIPKLVDKEQYWFGVRAGEMLRRIHQVPAPDERKSWAEHFNAKIDRKIESYKNSGVHLEGDQEMIAYIEQNRYLLETRVQCFQHGDYHIGNMVITPKGEIGIIDFNRFDYGDPWEEFNRIVFCADKSPLFASGMINGYFENQVPEDFFRLMALYIANNQLSSIPWGIAYGGKEKDNMIRLAKWVIEWYQGFERYIPSWYSVF